MQERAQNVRTLLQKAMQTHRTDDLMTRSVLQALEAAVD
jgi:hypothetical protein